jgi:rhamnulokinase
VGVELAEPILSEESRRANFTNEGGVDATIRYLRNVMGLWLLQESERAWRADGWTGEVTALLGEAAQIDPFRSLVDVDDSAFLPPGDMPARIAAYCARTGQPAPSSRAETVRCILDSLALAFRATVREALDLSGRTAEVVHLVGGGSRNTLLCQLTADACGLPVVAGPAEAAALGNILVQARAAGVVDGGLDSMRRLVRDTQPLRRYEPSGDDARWRDAAKQLADARAG